MSSRIDDPISKAFIKEAVRPGTKALEIGCAYGQVCLEALKRGARDYTANDLASDHLKILAQDLYSFNPDLSSSLTLVSGDFMVEDALKNEAYDVILISRVLHFMTPTDLEKARAKLFNLLKPEGMVFAIVATPYVGAFREFIPCFEKRIEENSPYPGHLENISSIANPQFFSRKQLESMVRPFTFFNEKLIQRFFEGGGFTPVTCAYVSESHFTKVFQGNGRESVGIVAQKKSDSTWAKMRESSSKEGIRPR